MRTTEIKLFLLHLILLCAVPAHSKEISKCSKINEYSLSGDSWGYKINRKNDGFVSRIHAQRLIYKRGIEKDKLEYSIQRAELRLKSFEICKVVKNELSKDEALNRTEYYDIKCIKELKK